MMKILLRIINFSFLMGLLACQKAELPPREYVEWIENEKNGLCVEKEQDDFTFCLQYKPIDYIILKQHKPGSLSTEQLNLSTQEMEGMQYFTLKISVSDSQQPLPKYRLSHTEDYAHRIAYFSTQMQEELTLVEGSDSLACLLFHFERAFDLSPQSTFLIGFEKTNQIHKDKTLIYRDQVFKLKPISITISADAIRNIPTLKLNDNDSKVAKE